jgi:hypothetical protein
LYYIAENYFFEVCCKDIQKRYGMKKKARINVDKRRQQIRKRILIFRGKIFQIMEVSGTFISRRDFLVFHDLRLTLDEMFASQKVEKDRKKGFWEKMFPPKQKNEKVLIMEFRCQYLYTGAVFEIASICHHAEQYYNEKYPNIIIVWHYMEEEENFEYIDGQIIQEATKVPVLFGKVKPPSTKFFEKTHTILGENYKSIYKKGA